MSGSAGTSGADTLSAAGGDTVDGLGGDDRLSSSSAGPRSFHTDPATGHRYELLDVRVTFGEAVTLAAATRDGALQGYLAAITTAAEDAFLRSLGLSGVAWIGGTDAEGTGTWRWVAGPEAGQAFHITGADSQPGYADWIMPPDPVLTPGSYAAYRLASGGWTVGGDTHFDVFVGMEVPTRNLVLLEYGGLPGDGAPGTYRGPAMLRGGDGADTLLGGGDADTLAGEAGDDSLIGPGAAGLLEGGAGRDTLIGMAAGSTLRGGADADRFDLRANAMLVEGGAGNDTVEWAASGASGYDVRGEDGDDSIVGARARDAILSGGDGDDTLEAAGQSELRGDDGDDLLRDVLDEFEHAENDGPLTMVGGAGRDTFQIAALRTTWRDQPAHTILDFEAGEGGDILDLGLLLPPTASTDLAFTGGDPFALGFLRLREGPSFGTTIEYSYRGAGDWRFVLFLDGVQPGDLVADNFAGGLLPPAAAVQRSGDGTDEQFGGSAFADTLAGGGGNDTLRGADGDDSLSGGAGDDVLMGALGQDTLSGGAGNDDLLFGPREASNTASYTDDPGPIHVVLDAQLGSGIDVRVQDGHGGADTLSGVQRIIGTDGADTVSGIGWLDGSPTGSDAGGFLLAGGGGRDVFALAARPGRWADRVEDFTAGADGDVIDIGALIATLQADGALAPGANPYALGLLRLGIVTGGVAVLQTPGESPGDWRDVLVLGAIDLEALVPANFAQPFMPIIPRRRTGGPGDDVLVGTALADTLDGAGGNDNLRGLGGEDLLSGGGGDDRMSTEGAASLDGGEGDDTLIASGAGAMLSGGAGQDRLLALAGDAWLDGGEGADRMIGGDGPTRYRVDDPGDRVIERGAGAGDGISTTLARHVLPVAVEDLSYTGSENFRGIGNAADNRLMGDTGDDRLFGLDGADTLIASEGRDTLVGGPGDDHYEVFATGARIFEAADGGIDSALIVLDRFNLPAGLEHVVFNMERDVRSGGNALDNRITSGDGRDTLAGGAGADTLDGRVGDDLLAGEDGDDVLLGGIGDRLLGGGGNDSLDGTGGARLMRGGEGADTLRAGFGGEEVLWGDAGDDVFILAPTTVSPFRVQDFTPGEDTILLRLLMFDGLEDGPLQAAQFSLGAPSGRLPQFVYDQAQGRLRWFEQGDADDGMLVAVFRGAPVLSLDDFVVA